MKLYGDDILFSHCAGKNGIGVFSLADDIIFIAAIGIVAVNEIKFAVVFYAGENLVRFYNFYGVPAHLGNFAEFIGGLKFFDAARQDSCAGCSAIFLTALKKQLHTDTYTEKRGAGCDDFFYGIENVQRFEIFHCRTGCANAWEDDFLGVQDIGRSVGNLYLLPDGFKRQLDAGQVSRFVVDYCYHFHLFRL